MRSPTPEDLALIGEVVGRDEAVSLAYAYGSALRADREPNDLDVAVLLAAGRRNDAVDVVVRVTRTVERSLGLGPADVRILDDAPVEFRHQVIATGRCVFARDPVCRVRFEADTLTEYLDFRPVIDEYNAAVRRRAREEAARWSIRNGSTGTSSS